MPESLQPVGRRLDQVAADPEGLFAAVRARLGIDLAAPPRRYEAGLLVRDDEPRHELAIRACLPEAYDVYLQLCVLAGRRSAAETAGPLMLTRHDPAPSVPADAGAASGHRDAA